MRAARAVGGDGDGFVARAGRVRREIPRDGACLVRFQCACLAVAVVAGFDVSCARVRVGDGARERVVLVRKECGSCGLAGDVDGEFAWGLCRFA